MFKMYEYNVTTNHNEKVCFVLWVFIKSTIRFYNNREFLFYHFDVENNNVNVILPLRPLIYFKKKMAAGIKSSKRPLSESVET